MIGIQTTKKQQQPKVSMITVQKPTLRTLTTLLSMKVSQVTIKDSIMRRFLKLLAFRSKMEITNPNNQQTISSSI